MTMQGYKLRDCGTPRTSFPTGRDKTVFVGRGVLDTPSAERERHGKNFCHSERNERKRVQSRNLCRKAL